MGKLNESESERREGSLGVRKGLTEAPGWQEHQRREARRLKIALVGIIIALAAVGGYWNYGRPQAKPAPPATPEQKLDEMARLARENPAAALGDRASSVPPRPLGEPAPERVIEALSEIPSRSGIIEPPPARLRAPTPTIAPVLAPDASMLSKEEQRLGKRPLPVDAQGYATLPDGTKVLIIEARPAAMPVLPTEPVPSSAEELSSPRFSQQTRKSLRELAFPARKENEVK